MQEKNKILILGGTEFVGRQLVKQLLVDGTNELYLFNRGKTNPDLFPQAHRIIGDRQSDDVEQLKDHRWDYVVDFSSYFPDSLQRTLSCINRDVKKYIYISTISVYDFARLDPESEIQEESQKKTYEEDQLKERSLKFYGEKKVACEDIVRQQEQLNWVILRPSLIYGDYDPTDRFYYWLKKIREREQLIVPNGGNSQITLTYARDFMAIIQQQLNADPSRQIYNCTTHSHMKLLDILQVIAKVMDRQVDFIPVAVDQLQKEDLNLHQSFPVWFGRDLKISSAKLRTDFPLDFASFEASVQATIEHYEEQNWRPGKAGISDAEEDELLNRLK